MAPGEFARLHNTFNVGRLIDQLRRQPDEGLPRVHVRRPDDLLVFDLLLDNLELATVEGEPNLVRADPKLSARLIVEFPPQSFGEEAFTYESETVKQALPAPPPARVRMSGPSRLSFAMPSDVADLPYTLADVLAAMRTWPLQLDISAQPDPDLSHFEVLDPSKWMVGLVASSVFRAARSDLATAMESAGAHGVDEAIAAAGKRIAVRAAGGLEARGEGDAASVAARSMQTEIESLQRDFPMLQKGPAMQAGLAALSLASAQSLTEVAGGFDLGDIVARWPYLPFLLVPHEPSIHNTALELPYRLILSPIGAARWSHSDLPVVHGDRTELWETRMRTAPLPASGVDVGPDDGGKVRAIWSPDYDTDPAVLDTLSDKNNPKPFLMSINARQRRQLVVLMAGYDAKALEKPYHPRAAEARRLHLSALGALLDSTGNWNPTPKGVDVAAWRHLAGLGRDSYVRIVELGYLLPFRHDAVEITVTERKFETQPGTNNRVAVLRQRVFIVVRKPVIDYVPSQHVHGGRNFPFTRVELLTRVTPNLATPGGGQSKLDPVSGGSFGDQVYWPMFTGNSGALQDVMFQAVATDLAGNQITFAMPMVFAKKTINENRAPDIRAAYDAKPTAGRRTADFGGATVAFAPFTPADKGDPRMPTAATTFAVGALSGGDREAQANFYPEVASASVGIRPVQKMLGQPNAVVDVTYPQVYVDHGFGESDPSKNTGQVFLQLINSAHELAFGGGSKAKSDALGGLASPQMSILGLSRVMGPVAGKAPTDPTNPANFEAALANVIGNKFDPTDFFKGATILGGVSLSDILTVVTTLVGDNVPKLVSQELPDRVEARFDWKTDITKSDPLNLIIPNADKASGTELEMHGLMSTPIGAPDEATYKADASIGNFKVNLFGFIIVWFDDLTFNASKGKKPDVAVNLHPTDAVMFGGPLEFVNSLRDIIPGNGFSDPPTLSITPSGITASYSMNLPAIGVGIFSLTNASLGAGFSLPFDNTPASVKFNFSERQHPFSLTVSMLGGGGFFAIGVSTRGVNEIEAALEFGAAIAIDLGVASGGVEIKAGVYFHWLEKIPDKGLVELTGYVRLHGELSVLGLISASLTFNLQLSYLKDQAAHTSSVWGEATLTIEVDVLFVSFDVSVSCRKEFAGAKSDPRFIELIPDEPTWAAYCDAFAPEAV